jgi:hypothetical protein
MNVKTIALVLSVLSMPASAKLPRLKDHARKYNELDAYARCAALATTMSGRDSEVESFLDRARELHRQYKVVFPAEPEKRYYRWFRDSSFQILLKEVCPFDLESVIGRQFRKANCALLKEMK